ncbi:hypothetical protein IT084_06250 [Desulfallas sp. Bu1-1]|uniref:hypothetical protein n=1 Tax=Desulfallas sp. Bu1-1 TaxID=2787620 RepID=UPI00189FF638|nr:hypothetical protein [Desulfallas sp. Bu1-1]MBF7082580.1 hypothetical protein [Desulfallas sp. Bu1-1]
MLKTTIQKVEQEVREKDPRITRVLFTNVSDKKLHLLIIVNLQDLYEIRLPLIISLDEARKTDTQYMVGAILTTVEHAIWGPKDYNQVKTTMVTS